MSKIEHETENISIQEFFRKHNIKYEKEHIFKNCFGDDGLPLSFDFYLPDYHCCVEIYSQQDKESIGVYKEFKDFLKKQKYNNIKRHYCMMNGIFLMHIPCYSKQKSDIATEDK